MKYLFIMLIAVFSYGIELSQNATNGREIYFESNCQKCHNADENFTPKAKGVKNVFDLKKWVSSCMTYFNHNWFPSEQKNVLIYINEIHYKFDLDKEKK